MPWLKRTSSPTFADGEQVYPWGDVLKRVVGGVEGVQEIDLPDHMPHHLLVKYNPEYTSSKSIQKELSYLGYHTKLISP